jgi:Ankyrin repeats (3 copies)
MLQKVKTEILEAFTAKNSKLLIKIANYLLENEQFDDPIIFGRSLVFLSVVNSDYKVFDYVFPRSHEPFKSDTLGENILTYMLRNNYPLLYVNRIVELIPDINLGYDNCKLLFLALSNISGNISGNVFSGISDLSSVNRTNRLVPVTSASTSNMKKWAEIIINHSKALDKFDKHGYTPLHIAVMAGDKKIVSLLRIAGCPSFLMNTRYLILPLELAVMNGNLDMVKSLLMFSDIDRSINKGMLKKIKPYPVDVKKTITDLLQKKMGRKERKVKKIPNEIEIIKLCEKHNLDKDEQAIIRKAMSKYSIPGNSNGSGKKLDQVCSELLVKIRLMSVKKML